MRRPRTGSLATRIIKQVLLFSAWAIFAAGTVACGLVSTAPGTGCRNDQAPVSAPIVATGAFTPSTGSISGNVTIYQLGTGSYEAFLNSFSGVSSTGGLLFIVKDSSGNQVLSSALLGTCGNQAYVFTDSDGTSLVQAAIYQTSPPEDLNQATLTPTS